MQSGSSAAGNCRILLVDDEPLVRSGTAFMLDELGHIVTEASSAQQALDIIASGEEFDIVMTDYRMPDMDGAELAARVKADYPDIGIVIMTGYSADDPRLADFQANCLEKPFGLDELERSVANSISA